MYPLFAAASGVASASVICRGFRRRARIRDLPRLQAARPVMVMVVLKVKRLMFVA